MVIRGVIDNQVSDYFDSSAVSGGKKFFEVIDCSVLRQYCVVICDIVTAIFKRRFVEGQQPDAINA